MKLVAACLTLGAWVLTDFRAAFAARICSRNAAEDLVGFGGVFVLSAVSFLIFAVEVLSAARGVEVLMEGRDVVGLDFTVLDGADLVGGTGLLLGFIVALL